MSTPTSFWQRLGNIWRGRGVASASGNGNGHSHADADAAAATAPEVSASPAESVARPLSRWGRREPTVAQMRDGYQRVFELMDAMEAHFRQQDERAQRLGQSVEQMVGVLDQLAESQRGQQEHVRAIADQVSAAGRHTAALSESLSQMPRSLQLQAEAVRNMLRRIEISQESDTQLMHSLQQLSGAVDGLNSASTAQVQTLQRLSSAEQEQREALGLLVREQGRRFVIILIVGAILSIGAIATLVTIVWLHVAGR